MINYDTKRSKLIQINSNTPTKAGDLCFNINGLGISDMNLPYYKSVFLYVVSDSHKNEVKRLKSILLTKYKYVVWKN